MNFSKLEKDILSSIYQNEENPVIKCQLATARPIKRKFTGMGVWVHLYLPDNVEAVPDSDGDITPILGPFIKSPKLKYGADSVIYITNGLLDTLEIFSSNDNFPEDLEHYELFDPRE